MSFLRTIAHMDQSYANFRRYMEIIDQLVKFGFGDFVNSMRFNRVQRWSCRIFRHSKCEDPVMIKPRPERFRLLLEALGPTFVKLGQVLASRPDLIPVEYAQELSKLQDRVPGFSGEMSKYIIEKEFGKSLEELYRSFDLEPFAAASIGQVHHAELRDGTPVVVKVQRPGIQKKISVDLEIMFHLAKKLEESDLDIATLHPAAIVEEFSHVLNRELNYVVEATHGRRFAEDMAKQPGIFIPHIYMELTSSRVLTMELVEGVSAREVLADPQQAARFDLKHIAEVGADAVMAQIFEYGFFHADPHPGNLFLLDDNRLCFIDFGMMGRVSLEERGSFLKAVNAMLNGEFADLTQCVLRLATHAERVELITLERDLTDLVQENLYLPIEKLSLARILEQLMKTMRRHGLTLRPDLFVMFKALMTIEGVARSFDPQLQIVEILKRTMKKTRWEHLRLRRKLEKTVMSAEDWWNLINEFPPLVHGLLSKAAEGQLQIKMEHYRLAPLLSTFQYSLKMLACAVIFSALLMSSALIVLSGVPPKINGMPLFGMMGFGAALLMGAYMLMIRRPGTKD